MGQHAAVTGLKVPRTFTASWGPYECGNQLLSLIAEADVVNLQHITDFFPYNQLIANIPREKPLVITLHDMLMFTGGCAYSESCRGFRERCLNCPQLKHPGAGFISQMNWNRLHDFYSRRLPKNTRIVADSDWLARLARQSRLFRHFQVERIYYGLNIDTFKPRDKSLLKNCFGLASGQIVIGFAAVSITNPRKGLDLLYSALEKLDIPVVLLSWGLGRPPTIQGLDHRHLGNIENESLLGMALGACDLFVIPSREEAFGQTALEAAACGIPSVGFQVGGVPEVVRDGVCGRICPELSADSLANTLAGLVLDPVARDALSCSARKTAIDIFSESVNAENYLKLYRDLVSSA
jgi:glycosyltransferase involved in cell wall biosynthesis